MSPSQIGMLHDFPGSEIVFFQTGHISQRYLKDQFA